MKEDHQQAAEHYNQMIWIIFSIGVGISLWILYNHSRSRLSVLTLTLGFVILIYSSMLVLSFSHKKKIHYKLLKKSGGGKQFEENNYLTVRYIGETILGFIILVYFLFLGKNFLTQDKGWLWWVSLLILVTITIEVLINMCSYKCARKHKK